MADQGEMLVGIGGGDINGLQIVRQRRGPRVGEVIATRLVGPSRRVIAQPRHRRDCFIRPSCTLELGHCFRP